MKLPATVLVILLFVFNAASHNNNNNNNNKKKTGKGGKDTLKREEHIIEMSGLLTIKGLPARNYKIFFSLDGHTIDTMRVEKARPVFFTLEQDKLYGLVFKKEGFPDKIVIVDTTIPSSVKDCRFFYADIEIELDNDSTTQKKDFLDFPVATICFDLKKQNFDYGHKYHNTVHIKK